MSNKKLNTLIENGDFPSEIKKLDKYDFANLFNVINKGENSYFNLCKNIYIDNVQYLSSDMVETYTIVDDDSWSSISYKFYRTYKLWWLICKVNDVKNPFYELIPGKEIKIPSKEMMESILTVIKSY